MNRTAITTAALAALAAPSLAGGGPGTGVALFDEMIPIFGPGGVDTTDPLVSDFYPGMSISSNELLFLGDGVSQGDSGNFDIEGTSGPAFLTLFSSTPGGTVTFSFDGPVDFLVDLIVTNENIGGDQDVICTVTTLRDGQIIETEILTLAPAFGDPDGQDIFRRFDNADTFHFQLAPNSKRILAFDFIEWINLTCGAGDINGDGSLDFFDVSAYLNLFSQGCP